MYLGREGVIDSCLITSVGNGSRPILEWGLISEKALLYRSLKIPKPISINLRLPFQLYSYLGITLKWLMKIATNTLLVFFDT